MPRPIVLGNGSLLVAYDDRYRIRDLTYPHVGLENHLCGHEIRTGFWVNGKFLWADGDGWVRSLAYAAGTLNAICELTHPDLPIRIETEEAVLPDAPVFIRRMKLHNPGPISAAVRVFCFQYLTISESDIGDCAFFYPCLQGIVHYKGPRWFLFGGRTSDGGVSQFTTGIRGLAGLEGVWRDAEDGALAGNAIAQGSVDSAFALHTLVGPGGSASLESYIVCGTSLGGLKAGHARLHEEGLERCLRKSSAHWSGWSAPIAERLQAAPEDIRAFAVQSALILRTQIDECGGILAANDSDIMQTNRANYSYVWPRDGALVADVLDRLGLHDESRRFFEFCARARSDGPPFLLQKYRADGTFGASWHPWVIDGRSEAPLQEDETALTLHALASHFEMTRDVAWLKGLYESFVKPAADFLVEHRDEGGLPHPSYDLWEERRGVHTFTAMTVVLGLRGAAHLALAVGDDGTLSYAIAAEEVLRALRSRLTDHEHGVLLRGLRAEPGAALQPDHTPDASLLLGLCLGVIDPQDPIAVNTAARLSRELWVEGEIGGLARYPGDYYFRQTESVPGNPWIICTLWLAQFQLMSARSPADLLEPIGTMRWAMRHAAPTGVLAEQLHPHTGAHLSVSPLTWAHSEFLKTALMLQDASEALGK